MSLEDKTRPPHRVGFTLIELAISMFIITLIATILLGPISAQVTQAKISQARADLDHINEALIGFALSQTPPRLPCPDTDGDGQEEVVGSAGCANTPNAATSGNVPWATLGVAATDPWGQRYQYRVNGGFVVPITLNPLTTPGGAACNPPGLAATGIIRVCGDAACVATLANGVPAVLFSRGPNGTAAPTSPDEIENTDNDCLYINRTYSSGTGTEFDDLVVWVSSVILISRLVSAQKLP